MERKNIMRYEWEDALIEAESLGLIKAGAVNFCLRLSKAITWNKTGRKSGLYWKNETAFKSVNSSKATYHRYRADLFEAGFLTEEGGNLIPQIPDLSQVQTKESQIETDKSQIETDESQIDNPYTVDTYTDDSSSVDKGTVSSPVVADAPTASGLDSETEKESRKDGHSDLLPVSTIVDAPSVLLTLETNGPLIHTGLPQSPEDADLPLDPPGRGNPPLAGIDYTEGMTKAEKDRWYDLSRPMGTGPHMSKADARAQVLHERELFSSW